MFNLSFLPWGFSKDNKLWYTVEHVGYLQGLSPKINLEKQFYFMQGDLLLYAPLYSSN